MILKALIIALLGCGAILAYLAPSIIAFVRRVPDETNPEVMIPLKNLKYILLLNLLLGWTAIGWVGSLIWAFMAGSPSAGRAAKLAKTYGPRAKEASFEFAEEVLEDILPGKEEKKKV